MQNSHKKIHSIDRKPKRAPLVNFCWVSAAVFYELPPNHSLLGAKFGPILVTFVQERDVMGAACFILKQCRLYNSDPLLINTVKTFYHESSCL